jgi:hypothetical protein
VADRGEVREDQAHQQEAIPPFECGLGHEL